MYQKVIRLEQTIHFDSLNVMFCHSCFIILSINIYKIFPESPESFKYDVPLPLNI